RPGRGSAASCNFSRPSTRFLVYSRCVCRRDPTVTAIALPWYLRQSRGGSVMTFEEILDHAIAILQRRGRLTYGTLKRQFQLDDAYLDDLKAELIEGQRLAADEDGRVLVWIGGARTPPASVASPPPHQEESLAA